jgi:UDP-3-O-[3-hydroxymyristoyl] N-acetylglucosamine deacetylase
VEPGAGCSLSVQIEWRHPLIRRQAITLTLDPATFARELAGARTFGFQGETATLRQRGLLKGARPGCGLLLSDTGLVHGRLRWRDEFARHKMLDVIGDLALLNGPWEGRIVATCPSHRGNLALARLIRCTASVGE